MKNLIFLIPFLIVSFNSYSHSKSIVKPSKNWFFLLESGVNKVNSKVQPNFGIGAEYSMSKKSGLTFRIKYLKTGIDYYVAGSSGGFGGFFGTSTRAFLYEGEVLKITANYKF